jgi:hypothetical protein
MPYAAETEVPIARSQQQIEAMLRQRGCEGYASAWSKDGNRIEFAWKGLRIRFTLPAVDEEKHKFDRQGRERSQTHKQNAVEQADRVRWRGLFLVIKAKLEAVEAGISVFEEEFMAFIVDPATDRTIGDALLPRIQGHTLLELPPAPKGGRK